MSHHKFTSHLRAAFLSLMLLVPVGAALASSVANGTELHLVARTDNPVSRLAVSEEDRDWLKEKRTLVLGVATPSFQPLEILSSEESYEGMTADAASGIATMLGLDVRVIGFSDRNAALMALEHGTVDMVGSANSYELDAHPVQLTRPYVDDVPVLYVRKGERRDMHAGYAGMRIAVAEDYLPRAELRRLYPAAVFVPYRSREHALAALAFGAADLYLGDAVSTNYLVNLSYFNYVRSLGEPALTTGGFAFAVRRDARRLEALLNAALDQLRIQHGAEYLKRWSGGGGTVPASGVALDAAERAWIAAHPVIRFVASNDTAPLSYFDSDGRFSGLSADILRAISQRTGLEFEPLRVTRLDEQIEALEQGRAEMTMLVPTASRESRMHFSRPFVRTSFGIITRAGAGQPMSTADLRGKRIAVPIDHAIKELLKPASDYHYVDVDTLADALDLVARGKADATVAFLPMALYYTSILHDGKLRVSDIVEDLPARLAVATPKDDPVLAGIIEKALLQIPPDEVDIFQNRWRLPPDVSPSRWTDYRGLIYRIGGGVLLLILVSLVWNMHIRSQYRHRQRAEAALGDQLGLMRSLINGTPHPIYVRDVEGRLVSCNTNYLDMLGVSEQTVMGKTSLEGAKMDRSEAQSFHDDYMWVMTNGKPLEVDRTLHLPGRVLSIYHWIYPHCDSQGNVKGVVCGWVDVSDRLQLTQELREALNAADQSSRAKTTFLATMSHEIRTPMSAVIGMLELALKRADQGDVDTASIAVAHDSAHGLLELIGDILDVVRIESGHLTLSPKRANLRELAESVVRVFLGLARQKSLHLRLEVDPSVDVDVMIDPMRFKQVLSNLVGNAIKFTDRGEVTVRIDGEVIAHDRLQMRLAVCDTGIGISDAELSRLFDPFVQGDHGHSSRGGTGLGLPICKSLCELMGGAIDVRSLLNMGTGVTVDLPLEILPALPAATEVIKAVETDHPQLRVLVIDDHVANRSLLTQQLAFLGQHVRSAEDGAQGLSSWEEEKVDVIVTDCNMPVMNGYDMARAIRRREQELGLAPCMIIGFTANAQPEERAKCLAAGMDDCLFKPVSLSALSTLLQTIGRTSSAVTAMPGGDVTIGSMASALHELTGGDVAMTRSLVFEAHRSFVLDLTELRKLMQDFSPRAMGNLVHRINGGVRLLQLKHLMDACERVEMLCAAPEVDSESVLEVALFIIDELEPVLGGLETMQDQMQVASDASVQVV